MTSRQPVLFAMVLTGALALTACNKQPESPAPLTDTKPAATPAVSLDSPLAQESIGANFRIVSGPFYNKAEDLVSYKMEIENTGTATVSSVGKHPFHIGVSILGADGTFATPPASQDFQRIDLPAALQSGEKLEFAVGFPAAPTVGGTVVVDGVQEGVAWLRDYGKPALEIGEFTRCSGSENTLCTADGAEVPVAQ